MTLAKQSTTKSFLVGPILDEDGAAKTNEVVASIKVTKNGSVGAPNGSSTLTHNHTGHYVYAANAGDFDTLGEVEFSLNSGTNAMAPVKFQVVPANVYDSLVSGSDYLDGAVVEWNSVPLGTTNPLPNAAADADGGLPTTTKITDARLAVLTDWINGGRLDLILDAIPSTGTGSSSWTINIKVSGNPIDGAEVRITSDEAGNTAVAGPKYTDASGDVDFLLDPGTLYVWVSASGYNFDNPTTVTVT